VVLAAGSAPLDAQTFDAAADFSKDFNTAVTLWSYRYKSNVIRDGNYSLLPAYGDGDGDWTPNDPGAWTLNNTVPELGVNRSAGDVFYASGPLFTWPRDAMLVHPGVDQLVLVSWLSPTATLLNISFSFSDLDPNGGNGIRWFVEKNNANSTIRTGTLGNGSVSGTQTVTGLSVVPGDRINFIVDPNGEYSFDSTKIAASITIVPEPSVVGLFAGAALGILALRRPARLGANA